MGTTLFLTNGAGIAAYPEKNVDGPPTSHHIQNLAKNE